MNLSPLRQIKSVVYPISTILTNPFPCQIEGDLTVAGNNATGRFLQQRVTPTNSTELAGSATAQIQAI